MRRFASGFVRSFIEAATVLLKIAFGSLFAVVSLLAFIAISGLMFVSGFGVPMMLFVAVMTGHVVVSLLWACAYFCASTFCAMILRFFWGPMIRRWFGMGPPQPYLAPASLDEPFMPAPAGMPYPHLTHERD